MGADTNIPCLSHALVIGKPCQELSNRGTIS